MDQVEGICLLLQGLNSNQTTYCQITPPGPHLISALAVAGSSDYSHTARVPPPGSRLVF